MKKIKTDELKKIQIEILDYIDEFCKKNNIKYWIDSGTLLGAVRHNGYIPWDDDIDIGMLRNDYDKFMKLFNDTNNYSKYEFLCYEKDKNWMFSFGKVMDRSTLLYEPDKKHGIEYSVYVDVFPYDNAPVKEKNIFKMFKKRDLYTKLTKLQRYNSFYDEKKIKYNLIRYPFHMLMQIFPKDYFVKKRVDLSKKYITAETNLVGNFSGISKQFCDKSVFETFIELEFEGKKYPAPVGYDKWLKSFYGDYMQLPPKEEQVSHHRFEAYFKDKGENMKKYHIGYTCGVFDLFHVGHLNLFERCKEMCDILIVGICDDNYVRKVKSKEPVFSEAERLRIINALKVVDRVELVDIEITNDKMLALDKFKFDVLFSGDDWKGSERYKKTEKEFSELGVKIEYLPYTKEVSTTKLKEKIKNL